MLYEVITFAVFREGPEMLFGEDLRRGHEKYLVPRINGDEGRGERDEGLPASHVTLEEAVHRSGFLHVPCDFVDYCDLCFCQREGQPVDQGPRQSALDPEGDTRESGLQEIFSDLEDQLHDEQLFERNNFV